MAALPGIALVLIYLGFSGSRTLALGKSWLLVFVLSALFTEVSSAFSAFNFSSLIIAWLCICVLAFIRFLFSSKKKFSAPFLPDREELLLLTGIGIIQLITLIIAVKSAPNNWDSMTYHLSRVAHWADQHSVVHFFTAIDRQISQPPGAEFLIAQLYILEGSDKWANLIQWSAGLVALAGVYRIGLFLGESKKVGLWSAFIASTVPMFILQSSSTQNDLLVASFLLWTMAFALESLKGSNIKSISILHWAGLAFAAAVLTKGTALVFGIPIFMLLLIKTWRRFRTKIILPAATALLFLLLLNGPHWTRNIQEFNTPLGPSYGLANEPIAGPAIFLNTTKNLTHQLRSPVDAVNTLMERAVHGVHSVLGFDVNQGALHWSGSPGFSLVYQGKSSYLHEDYGPGPLHILLFIIALVWIGFKGDKNWKIYALFCLFLILIFSAVLKWQIWHARLLLPFYLFISPLIAWLFLRIPKWPAAILFFLCAIPFLIQNHSRPLIGQTSVFRTTQWEQRFANRTDVSAQYTKSLLYLGSLNCQRVGLITSGDSWEYPAWLLKPPKTVLRHINPEKIDGMSEDFLEDLSDDLSKDLLEDSAEHLPEDLTEDRFRPQALLVWKKEYAEQDSLLIGGRVFRRVISEEPAVFVRESK